MGRNFDGGDAGNDGLDTYADWAKIHSSVGGASSRLETLLYMRLFYVQ